MFYYRTQDGYESRSAPIDVPWMQPITEDHYFTATSALEQATNETDLVAQAAERAHIAEMASVINDLQIKNAELELNNAALQAALSGGSDIS